MVGKVGVHDDHECAGTEVEAVDVGCAEAEFACARLQDLPSELRSSVTCNLVLAIRLGELVRNLLRAIWACVIDDDDLPV